MGGVVWITGLSGAGKTTLANALVAARRAVGEKPVLLDGDELRAVFGLQGAHGRDERLQLALTYARLAGLIASQGVEVFVATMSLFHEVHAFNRAHLPRYVELLIDVPIDQLERQDSKGVYSSGAGPVAGRDFAAELPTEPHLRFTRNALPTAQELLRRIDAIHGGVK